MFEYRSVFDRSFTDPFGWSQLVRTLDRAFEEADRDLAIGSTGYAPARFEDEGSAFVLKVEVPGVVDKDVHVDLHNGVLTLTAERSAAAPEGYSTRRRERAAHRFARSYALGAKVDPEKTSAELKDGVLTVRVAKTNGAQKKNIAVTAA
jgi:HSP20 family protein